MLTITIARGVYIDVNVSSCALGANGTSTREIITFIGPQYAERSIWLLQASVAMQVDGEPRVALN